MNAPEPLSRIMPGNSCARRANRNHDELVRHPAQQKVLLNFHFSPSFMPQYAVSAACVEMVHPSS